MSTTGRKIAKAAKALAMAPLVLQSALAASHGGKKPKLAGAELAPTDLNYIVELGGNVECTGTLIGPEHVLTTATCFLDEWGDLIWDSPYFSSDAPETLTVDNHQVGLGLGLTSTGRFDVYVPSGFGPEYQPTYKEYFRDNIAVVHIPALSQWGYDARYPSLPTSRSEVTGAHNTVVVSAGEPADSYENAVRYAPYTIVEGLGVTPYGADIEIESDHFTVESDAGASLCDGDHGAALIDLHKSGDCGGATEARPDVLLGLSSWTTGYGCVYDGVAAFVDVLSHVDFIREAMSGSIEPRFASM